MDWLFWEAEFEQFLMGQLAEAHGAHDLAHVERVAAAFASAAGLLTVPLPGSVRHQPER